MIRCVRREARPVGARRCRARASGGEEIVETRKKSVDLHRARGFLEVATRNGKTECDQERLPPARSRNKSGNRGGFLNIQIIEFLHILGIASVKFMRSRGCFPADSPGNPRISPRHRQSSSSRAIEISLSNDG